MPELPERRTVRPLIMIADDNAHSRELLRTVLEQDGYEVVDFKDGNSIVAAARRQTPALILLDLKMPGLDGFQTLSVLQSMSFDSVVPVVALTASAMQGDRERILAMGFAEYLPKPVHLPKLRQAVNRLVREH